MRIETFHKYRESHGSVLGVLQDFIRYIAMAPARRERISHRWVRRCSCVRVDCSHSRLPNYDVDVTWVLCCGPEEKVWLCMWGRILILVFFLVAIRNAATRVLPNAR